MRQLLVDFSRRVVDPQDRGLDSFPFHLFGVWLVCFHFLVVNRDLFIKVAALSAVQGIALTQNHPAEALRIRNASNGIITLNNA